MAPETNSLKMKDNNLNMKFVILGIALIVIIGMMLFIFKHVTSKPITMPTNTSSPPTPTIQNAGTTIQPLGGSFSHHAKSK